MLQYFAFHILINITNLSFHSVDSITSINQSLAYLGQEIKILHCYYFAYKCKPFVVLISCALLIYMSAFSLNGMDSFLLIKQVNQQQRQKATLKALF